jgi:ABC-type antimicrobial peptide transport system permease subunit
MGFLGTIGFIALVHAIVSTSTQRRRDLAVFQAMGVTRTQLALAVLVSATVPAVIGGLIGIPAGILLGRALWRDLARSLGVGVAVTTPFFLTAVVLVAGMALFALLAVLPTRSVLRVRPAAALRTE